MKTNNTIIEEQKAWIASGKIGCVFASALVKQADKIGWHFNVIHPLQTWSPIPTTHIVSVIFSSDLTRGAKFPDVWRWAMRYGMKEEVEGEKYVGLRIHHAGLGGNHECWVQYFGPDSPVKTRQAPYPMLMWTQKLPAHIYAKTMVQGIYHLAHASIEHLSAKVCDTLWNQSFEKTKKILGSKPGLREAARVTYMKGEEI